MKFYKYHLALRLLAFRAQFKTRPLGRKFHYSSKNRRSGNQMAPAAQKDENLFQIRPSKRLETGDRNLLKRRAQRQSRKPDPYRLLIRIQLNLLQKAFILHRIPHHDEPARQEKFFFTR